MLTENHLEVGTAKAKSYLHIKSSSLWILNWEVRAEGLLWVYVAIPGNGCSRERKLQGQSHGFTVDADQNHWHPLPLPRSQAVVHNALVLVAIGKTIHEITQVFFILLTYRLPKNTAKAEWIQEAFSTDLCKCCIKLKFFSLLLFFPERKVSVTFSLASASW